jgi:hypothetical protein
MTSIAPVARLDLNDAVFGENQGRLPVGSDLFHGGQLSIFDPETNLLGNCRARGVCERESD